MNKTATAILLTFSAFQFVGAQSLISNIDQPPVNGPVVYSGQWIALGVRTGPDPAQVDSVTLYQTTSGSPSGSFFVSIHSDAISNPQNPYHVPGDVLPGGILNGPLSPVGSSLQTYTVIQPLQLAPNSIYWVVASSDSTDPLAPLNNTFGWSSAASLDYTSSSGWSMLHEADGSNGYYPAYSTSQGAGWLPSNLSPVLFEIGGTLTVVPESHTIVLIGVGLIVVLFCRRSVGNRLGIKSARPDS